MASRAACIGAFLSITLASLAASTALSRDAETKTIPEHFTQGACDLAHSIAAASLGTAIQRSSGVFFHDALQDPVRGCRLVITGSFEEAPAGQDAASRLREGFTAQGWQEMPAYSADGKDGTAFALRKADVACLFRGTWNGGSDGEPSMPREDTYRVSVLCTSPAPPEERTRQS